MTDEQWIELGRRVVACKGWRWMPGMAWVIPPEARGIWPKHLHRGRYPVPEGVAPVPDLRDPATLGCLLALVREAWDDPFALVDYDRKHWGIFVEARDTVWVCTAKTEAAALVAALKEAAND